jgi:copper transport protein
MLAEEPLVFSDIAREYASFLAAFAAIGAVGFRWFPMRPMVNAAGTPGGITGARERIARRAGRTAAILGLLGALVTITFVLLGASGQAAEKHTSIRAVLTAREGLQAIGLGLMTLAVLGFLVAAAGIRAGWILATFGVIGNSLKNGITGDPLRLVNPVHVMMASLWIGTLAVLTIAGLSAALRSDVPRDDRGPAVAAMVNAFSPLALFSAAFLAMTGVVTAWRHLKVIDNLWSTPYGQALMVKLALVLCVVVLGAWNWRRVRPSLGGEDAARHIRRSATRELLVAALVLGATAVLVSLPAPKGPGGAGGPGGPGGPGGSGGGPPPAAAPNGGPPS